MNYKNCYFVITTVDQVHRLNAVLTGCGFKWGESSSVSAMLLSFRMGSTKHYVYLEGDSIEWHYNKSFVLGLVETAIPRFYFKKGLKLRLGGDVVGFPLVGESGNK
jgi:hypothetical protein